MSSYTPYTYLVIHKETGLWYYGVRYAKKCNPTDLWDRYFTSSNAVKALIEKDGPNSFKIEVRRTFNTAEEACNWEFRVLKRVINFINCLNYCAYPALSLSSRQKGHDTMRKKKDNGLTIYQESGLKWKARRDLIDPKTGKTFLELRKEKFNQSLDKNGTRKLMGEYTSARMKKNNPSKNLEVKKKISQTLIKRWLDGSIIHPTKGKKMPKTSLLMKGNKYSVNRIWTNNGTTHKRIKQGEQIPQGFVIGRLTSLKGYNYKELICPHCGVKGGGGNMTRFHFDLCKKKP